MDSLFDIKEYDRRTIQCDEYLASVKNVAPIVTMSVSSGKSSTRMALNKDPEDNRPYFYQFAVVLSNDPNARPKDKGLLRECQKRIPWFEASHEVDKSLLVILKLEQELQQAIRWVASEMTLEELIDKKKALPDRSKRFCTERLKYEPLFWDTYLNLSKGYKPEGEDSFIPMPFDVEMQIGYRWDERQRVYRSLGLEKGKSGCDSFFYPYCCDITGQYNHQQRWRRDDWRIRTFPLYSQRITAEDIWRYWENRNWDYDFPEISNCTFCFNKDSEELQKQAILYPERLPNWLWQEEKTGRTFNKKASLKEIIFSDVTINSDSNCHCTD